MNIADYNKMTETEFLEFIVRMSNALYKDNPKKNLADKVDLLLVKLLGIVKTLKFPPYEPDDSDDEEEAISFNY